MVNSNVTTIILDGNEIKVEFGSDHSYYQITNKGDTDIYASMSPNITPETDGVYTVSAGGSEIIGDGYPFGAFYLLGTGKAYIRGKRDAMSASFKLAAKGGDSGGSVDLTAYLPKKLPDVYMSAGTKTMKQVCDEIKSWWSENYNNFSVFRFLGGFESDVIDGWNSNKFLGSGYTWQLTPINNYFNTANNGTFILSAIATSDSVLVYIVGLCNKAWAAPKKIVTGELTDEDIAKLNSITPEMIEKLRNL